jgi:maltose-binding protein MalE
MQRVWWWLLLGLFCGLTACGTAPVKPVPVATTTPQTTPTTLVVWHALGGNNELALRDVLTRIANANGFTVILQRIPITDIQHDVQVAFAQSRGPHLVILSNAQLQTLASNDCCLVIDTLLDVATRNALDKTVLATAQYTPANAATQIIGLPISYALPVLYYNTHSVISPPSTSDDLIGLAHNLRNPPQWGLGADLTIDTMYGYLAAFGGAVVDDQGQVVLADTGRAGSEAWLTWLTTLNNDPLMQTRLNAIFTIEQTVGAGQLSMVIDSSANHQTYAQLWGDATGVTTLPLLSITNQSAHPLLQSTVVAVNKHLSLPELVATRTLLNALLTQANQTILLDYGIQPANRLLSLADHPVALAIQTASADAVAPPRALTRDDVYATLTTMLNQVVFGTQTPADAVTATDAQLRLLLEGTTAP